MAVTRRTQLKRIRERARRAAARRQAQIERLPRPYPATYRGFRRWTARLLKDVPELARILRTVRATDYEGSYSVLSELLSAWREWSEPWSYVLKRHVPREKSANQDREEFQAWWDDEGWALVHDAYLNGVQLGHAEDLPSRIERALLVR